MKASLHYFLSVLVFAFSTTFASAVIFITHPSGPDSLDTNEVKNILLGNMIKWNAGDSIRLAVLAQCATHEAVVRDFTARSTDQFDKYWKRQVFTGKGVPPDIFKTDEDMVTFVSKTPGSFGYISDGSALTGVKVVQVK